MVEILEKIELLVNQERFINYKNPFGEIGFDNLFPGNYEFEKGKIIGIVSEHGGGGESISRLLSGEEPIKDEQILVDGQEITSIECLGWYVGKALYRKGVLKREYTVKRALEEAIDKYKRFNNIDEVIDLFHLDTGKLKYKTSNNCLWERWRSSVAIGYAEKKQIFCFPWMNTADFYSCLYNSSVFRLFDLIRKDSIIVLTTSRIQNLKNVSDVIITIDNPAYNRVLSESDYYKKYRNQ